jgi:starch-binding outer membrane protein, SusD/RagB family
MRTQLNIKRIILGLLVLTTLTSCEDFLDLRPTSSLSTGNAFNTAQDLNNAIAGAYRTFYTEYYQWDYVLLGDVRSDNAYCGGTNDAPIYDYDQLTIKPGSDRMIRNWCDLYQGIGRCNIIIGKLNEINDPELDRNDLRKKILGQASFLRAFHYFNLVKNYGGVPLELNSNSADPLKTNLPRSSEKEVYDQIVKDLEVAVANLPDKFSDDNKENKVRATKGAANAMLAKVWAQRAEGRDYQKVITYCNAVINSPAGYKLLGNYALLFDGANYMNDESILEISFMGNDWDVSNWGVQLFVAPQDGWQKYCIPSVGLVGLYNAEGDVSRFNANIVFWDNPDWADENWDPCKDPAIKVPFNYKQKNPNGWNSGDHPYLLRLSDIILLKAEAQNETGDLNGALTSLNLVRKRAGLPNKTASSKEDLRAKILDERRLELAFEGHRFDDLVRLGLFVSTMNNVNDFKYTCGGGTKSSPIKVNYNASPEKILCPIPQRERDTNQNLTQNPGY